MSSNLRNKSNKSDKFDSIYGLTPNRMHLFVDFNSQNSQSINLIIFSLIKI